MRRALLVLAAVLIASEIAYEALLHALAGAGVPPALLSGGSNAAIAYAIALTLLVALRVVLLVLAPPAVAALLLWCGAWRGAWCGARVYGAARRARGRAPRGRPSSVTSRAP